MRLVTHLLVAAVAAGAMPGTASSQPAAWTRLDGPRAAGLRTAAVASNGTLLAATYVDVLRHGGAGWAGVAGAINGSIHDIGTATGGRVWAGTSGALRSDDFGSTWQWFSIRTAPHSGTHPAVLHVAQAPSGMVFAGGYRSPDGGGTWPELGIYAYATAFVGTTTFAGTADGVQRSANGGSTWTPSGLQGVAVNHMATTGSRLVAATEAGIFISDDGQTWIATCTLPQVDGLAVAGDGAVWAAAPTGLYRSPDGIVWPFEPTAFAGMNVLDVAANGSTMLAVVDGNPYRSDDAGANWTDVHDGLGFPFASAVALGGGVLTVAANGAGPFRSDDGGTTWSRWTEGLPGPGARAMFVDAGAGHQFARTHSGLYRAELTGGAWTAIPLPDALEATGLASDGEVLVAAADGASFEQRIYRSTDAGTTWTLARTEPDGFQPVVAAGGGVSAVSIVGFFSPPRLLVSGDGGVTWTSLPHPTAPTFGASPGLFVDAAGRVYVEDGNRLRRSSDLGGTWELLGPVGGPDNRVTSLHTDAAALCVGSQSGAWCSADDGATFAPAGAGLPAGPVVGLVGDGARYFALTGDAGVFTSDAVTAGGPAPGGVVLDVRVTPNPAAGRATAAVTLEERADVRLHLFDALGRQVAVLHEGVLPSGRHAIAFATSGLTPGSYVLRLLAGERSASARLGVVR